MISPLHWLRRKVELYRHTPYRLATERQFQEFIGEPVKLVPAYGKGGADEVYFALRGKKKIAVVRINSKYRKNRDRSAGNGVVEKLDHDQRIDREWDAYNKLTDENISPKPLWRSDDAIACSWLDWERSSRRLVRHRKEFWVLIDRIIPAVAKMHDCRVVHLDLNLGNILVETEGKGVAIIDFEYGSAEWVSPEQERAFDYLRLIDDCIRPRRGGDFLLSDVNRLIDLLAANVEVAVRNADLSFVGRLLKRLPDNPELYNKLKTIFPNLP